MHIRNHSPPPPRSNRLDSKPHSSSWLKYELETGQIILHIKRLRLLVQDADLIQILIIYLTIIAILYREIFFSFDLV